MKDFNFKSILPHLLVVLVFMVLTIVYFNPLLSGKAINQGDVERFKGMSKEIVDYRETYHKEPLWTNGMFSGMPAYQISVLYPSNWVRPLIKLTAMGIPHPACIIFLCMLGFYFLLLTFKVDRLLAAKGGEVGSEVHPRLADLVAGVADLGLVFFVTNLVMPCMNLMA
jgi:hypothetical protein